MCFIQPTSSLYGTLVLFIKKKDGLLHLCVNFSVLTRFQEGSLSTLTHLRFARLISQSLNLFKDKFLPYLPLSLYC